ncbi:MAG: MFS transporter [Candidatus Lokiarchaeota archaeon]|nr:MFS transporter [Candidatus Lokiarchaeota archaeon]MBD3198828.1 MFS transporter [Candidatus Lokiarchaeota archaeon]
MSEQQFGRKQKWSFGLGSFAQWFINGAFNTWVLSFYFSAVKLPISYIMIAFVLWTIWNAFNDPLIGYLSDKTQTKWGRRKPYIMLGSIPIIVIEIIIWLPRPGSDIFNFIYLLIMLLAYDTFYTMVALPYDSLFPELYTSVDERAEVNTIKQILSTLGLILAFIVPGIFIGETLSDPSGYLTNGIVTSILVGVSLLISIKYGVIEREEFKLDHAHEFKFLQSLKYSLNNKGFLLYTAMFFLYEYILLVLAATVPLYGEEVLGVSATLTSIMLGVLFIVAILAVLVWRKLDIKIGSRKAYAISIVLYFFTTLPFLFIEDYIYAIITVVFMGIGFGGMLYFIYLLIADVVDEDELKTGVRREGSFFGITNFFMRLAMVASIVTIGSMFISTGWEEWVPDPNVDTLLALRLLIVVFPGIALGITLVCLYYYPFPKEKVTSIKEQLNELHRKKKEKVQKTK